MFEYWHKPITKMKRRQRYPTMHKCIYCGECSNPASLTTEHIIPEALGGALEFFRASCDDCQRRIEKFEGRMMNSTFAGARAILGIKSKRSRPREKVHLIEFGEDNNSGKFVYIDKSFHQGTQILLGFGEPKFLTDKTLGGEWSISLHIKSLREDALELKDTNIIAGSAIWLDVQLDMKRMLAKIAHSYWLAENPTLKLTPCLTNFIRGECEGAFDLFIGDSPDQKGEFPDLHYIDHGTIRDGAYTYGYVDIQLFSCFPVFHTYRVYVGSVGDPIMNFHFTGAKMPITTAIKSA